MQELLHLVAMSKILQSGKIIIWNNQLYFGNSSNAPTAVTPTSISASIITSGTLSSDRLPTIPITKGGTNATSASTALSNLGGFPKTGGTISGATNIQGKLDVQNNAMHIGSGNSGAKLNFGDGDYVYLYESPDDTLVIYADKGVHLKCGSSSSYDITAQKGSNTAISLLGGGNSATFSIGTFSGTSSVNLGFKPAFVILATSTSSFSGNYSDLIFITRYNTYRMYDSVGTSVSKINSSGFCMDGCGFFSTSATYYYIAFKP